MTNDLFENLSISTGVGVTVLDVSGKEIYISSVYTEAADFLKSLLSVIDCVEAERVALLYGAYQSLRFGDRYIFFAPSGMTYCASPLTNTEGEITAGIIAGPFLMVEYDEYLQIDVLAKHTIDTADVIAISKGITHIPLKTPAQARAISELLFICTDHHSTRTRIKSTEKQPGLPKIIYPIEKEDELLAAISNGDINSASALLNEILGQMILHSKNDLDILRSRVVEITVLLSRAALKGGANINAILGLNYEYLREIDAVSSADEIVLWLNNVTRRFAQHVFDYADSKHVDVIYKSMAFIKKNYADKISLQDIADSVYLNQTYFAKIFKDETGQTPGSFITATRIEESKKLLRNLDVNIVDIPEMTGFESQSYFTKVFKKTEGCTPGRFRQKYISGLDSSSASGDEALNR